MSVRRRLLLFVFTAVFLSLLVSASYAAEIQLAGVKLGRSAMSVLKMFGNPSEMRIGAAVSAAAASPTGAPAAASDDEDNPMARMAAALSRMQSGGGAQTSAPGQQAGPARPKGVEVTWVYRFKTGNSIEVLVSPSGHIIQIACFGGGWPQCRTSKGITFGNTYKDILFKYGFPETQSGGGGSMTIGYPTRNRVIFSLAGNTVTGITIALMD